MANEGGLNWEEKKGKVTVLFADIRNFTNISEQMKPEEIIVNMLNICLPVVIEV